MSKYIATDVLKDICPCGYCDGCEDCRKELENAPSIDIVRCKECKHGTYCEEADMYICNANDQDLYEAEHFCSYGERRSDEVRDNRITR